MYSGVEITIFSRVGLFCKNFLNFIYFQKYFLQQQLSWMWKVDFYMPIVARLGILRQRAKHIFSIVK